MAKPAWLEVSLTINGELAEAVAETLSRFVEGGIVIEKFQTESKDDKNLDEVRVFGYLTVNDHMDETKNSIKVALGHLAQIQSLPEANYKYIEDRNWMEAWKKNYHPIKIGRRFLIMPAWLEIPKDTDRLVIQMEPGMAFGTGTHPSTQLSLKLMEDWVKPGQDFIDIGAGSGVLSIGAWKLGARKILAVDIDNQTIAVAKENFKINGIDEIEIGLGSIDEIMEGNYSIDFAPIVMANILSKYLIQLIERGMGELVSDQGVLILSGILEEGERELIDCLESNQFEIVEKIIEGDWIALVSKRI